MTKDKQILYIRKEISKFLEQKDVEKVLKVVDDILDEGYSPDLVTRLIYYTDKQYQKKYGTDEIFIDYPVSAKVRVDYKRWLLKNKIDEDTCKKYIRWLVAFDNVIMKRRVNVYDLYNDRIWNNFNNKIQENTESLNEKNNITKKKIFKL